MWQIGPVPKVTEVRPVFWNHTNVEDGWASIQQFITLILTENLLRNILDALDVSVII